MSEVVIKVENLSKKYTIRHQQRESYTALRDVMAHGAKRLGAKLLSPFTFHASRSALRHSIQEPLATSLELSALSSKEDFWALKDVSFEVKQGEVIGIIGRNGAGKSTLLKILSRITEPTTGSVKIKGRVASLLEVGTGFHPELTGRENIYLNGAILGMTRAEIKKKFEEIVAFAEIEKFLDTPVKRYSSGMYVRLAFAVAAHLEPEILLVDEVLAVGDAEFQKKCLGKMGDVAKEGRTVLFVSHNMAAVNRLCHRGICLDEGRLQMAGSAESVVAFYLSTGSESEGERRWEKLEVAPGNEKIRLRAVAVINSEKEVTSIVDVRFPFYVEIEYEVLQPLLGVQVGFWLLTSDGIVVFVAGDNEDRKWLGRLRDPGHYKSICKVPGLLLNSGVYALTVASDMRNVELLFAEENTLRFHVEQTQVPAHSYAKPAGVICPFLEWRVSKLE